MAANRGYQNLDEDSLADGYQSFAPSVNFASQRLDSSVTEPLSNDIFASPSVPRAPQSHQVAGDTEEGRARRRWDHQNNLDQFFSRIYEYHQRGGFGCILLEEVCELLIFLFIVSLSTFLIECVDYPILFAEKLAGNASITLANALKADTGLPAKVKLKQALVGNCVAHFSFWVWICLLVAALFWLLRLLRSIFQLLHFWEIKNFYLSALKIDTTDLSNLTWHEILQCLCQAQQTEELVIHSQDLTELDIYQRILRHKNYMVAFVNRGLFPPKLNFPFLGTVAYFPHGLKHNIEFLLFWGSWAPWKDYYTLKPEFKRRDQLLDASIRLEQMAFWLGIANILLFPLIFLWQILYWAFQIAELVKREPGALGKRNWSLYGQHYFRHFNELDHELKMRLNRAYRPAAQYQDLFVPKLGEILARNVALVFGALFAVLAALSVWDEDVLQVEHVLTAMTVFGFIVYVCGLYIPDENLIWCPELLMKAILAQVHYLPDTWKGYAHTDKVRQEFSQLFQFKAFFFLEELLSPIITPFVLLGWLRPRIKRFAEFFHQFTVEVEALGDVCSFAQMDVVKHGDRKWQGDAEEDPVIHPPEKELSKAKSNNGKTEMSLVHFAVTNPAWAAPPESAKFLQNLRRQAMRDAEVLHEHEEAVLENPLLQSLTTLGFPSPLSTLATQRRSIFQQVETQQRSTVRPSGRENVVQFSQLGTVSRLFRPPEVVRGRGVRRSEGPLVSSDGLLSSLHLSARGGQQQQSSSIFGESESIQAPALLEGAATEMSLHALYLHELHQQRLRPKSYGAVGLSPSTTTDNSPTSLPPLRADTGLQMQPPQAERGEPSPKELWELPKLAMLKSEEPSPEDEAPKLFESA